MARSTSCSANSRSLREPGRLHVPIVTVFAQSPDGGKVDDRIRVRLDALPDRLGQARPAFRRAFGAQRAVFEAVPAGR